MATARLIQEKSAPHYDGTCLIKVILSNGKKVSRVSTGISVFPYQWDDKNKKVIRHPTAKKFNLMLTQKLCEAQLALMEAMTSTAREVRLGNVRKDLEPFEDNKPDLCRKLDEITQDNRLSSRTRDIYARTLKKIKAYYRHKGYSSLKWEQIKPNVLDDFDRWLSKTCPNPNARAIHMRNIRRAFNLAIIDEITTYYPFKAFKIKYARTAHRALSADTIRELLTYPCEPQQKKYQDFAKFMFMARGMNVVDFCHLRMNDISGECITFSRQKTGTIISVRILPEMQEIIDQYHNQGSKWVFPVSDTNKDYRNFAQKLTHALRNIGPEDDKITPKITSYFLRHSWATIAADLDIPKETIAEGLGHSIGNDVTSIYISFNQKKVDEATRKVIDHVFKTPDHSEESAEGK